MKWYLLFGTLVFLASAWAEDSESVEDVEELPFAEPCDANVCQLPDCRCSTTDIPGGLRPRDTPQFVMVTFDDAVNIINIVSYRDILYRRINSGNRCPAGATFYVSHEYTNYQLVNELYNQGFEIALHSISHREPTTWWANATYQDIKEEFVDQRQLMAHFANIPIDSMNGIRQPFLQLSGNTTYQVMRDHGITYDSSWPTTTFVQPGLWPYTLDYASSQDCVIDPCPTASAPGVWVFPMIAFFDLGGLPCAMADACFHTPNMQSEQEWFEFLVQNFERQYLNNRAPFGIYLHQGYLQTNPAVQSALIKFLDLVNSLNDVFMVNSLDVIEWVKDPKPLEEYRQQQCKLRIPAPCSATTCTLSATHNSNTYWATMCATCPAVYPWVGNPLGENR